MCLELWMFSTVKETIKKHNQAKVHSIYHKKLNGGNNMSELTATQCGCSRDNCSNNNSGCSSWIWIIILLFFCGGCGNNNDCGCGFGGMGNFFGGNGCDNGNSCCEWIIILILLFSCCGNNNC